jgi:hypothetical protein
MRTSAVSRLDFAVCVMLFLWYAVVDADSIAAAGWFVCGNLCVVGVVTLLLEDVVLGPG